MNARQQLKPKTIRLAILLALADGAITTIDDLQTKIDEPRKKVAGAVYPAAVEGLIKRMRDDVTGAPAYQITADGRKYLVKYSGSVEEPSLPETAVCTESQTAVITPGVKVDIPDRHEPTASAIIGAMAFGYQGCNEPPAGHWLAEFYQRGAADARKDAEIAQASANLKSTERMFHAAVSALASISDRLEVDPDEGGAAPILSAIEAKDIEICRLSDELASTKATLELSRLAHAAPVPFGYVIQRPAKPLVRITKHEKAQARALSFARSGQRAQVFALVPVGAAVPGAEWVEA